MRDQDAAAVAVNGQVIRKRRKLHGETVTALAKRVGISQQYLSFIERGDRRHVSPPVFANICDALGVPVESRSELMLDEADAGRAA